MDSKQPAESSDSVTPDVVVEADEAGEPERPQPYVSEPSKLIRIASMTRAMLDEVREAPLDDAGRIRLLSIYDRSLEELKEVLSDDLIDELDAVFVPIGEETPTEAELRVAQAQLVGWLEGLFHGIQASLISQQMAASAQLERMRQRRAIEGGTQESGSGLYL
ncbi:MAG: bacterial proteasome activator family protein [Actinomycetia bacterium]|nr:bacterial proteasome activator family protein [Actinomycetes bacterium]